MRLPAGVWGMLSILAAPASPAIILSSTLNGSGVSPANSSSATGFGTVTLNDAQTQIDVSLQVFNLEGFAASAGIYGPGSSLRFPLAGVPFSQSFQVFGQFAVNQQDVANLLAYSMFFAVSSTAYPQGHIGGFIGPSVGASQAGPDPVLAPEPRIEVETPEPGTAGVVLLGLALCVLPYAAREIRRITNGRLR